MKTLGYRIYEPGDLDMFLFSYATMNEIQGVYEYVPWYARVIVLEKDSDVHVTDLHLFLN